MFGIERMEPRIVIQSSVLVTLYWVSGLLSSHSAAKPINAEVCRSVP